jgi:peptidylprolyl isomerase
MKTVTTLLIVAAAAAQLTAQIVTPAKPPATGAPATAARKPVALRPCSKLPELSPKIPALPAGLPCAKPLYVVTIKPNANLDYVAPIEGPELRETLGILPSSFSLDYIDTKIGAGQLAAPHMYYTINYTGYLADGAKFDSSSDHGEPYVFGYGLHQAIPGWDTGFDGMRVGGKRRLFIPYQLAYGPNGKPAPPGQVSIPPKAELIFDVELVSQSDQKPAPKAPPPGMMKPSPMPPGLKPPSPPAGTTPAAPAPGAPAATPAPTAPTTPATTPQPTAPAATPAPTLVPIPSPPAPAPKPPQS